MLRDRSAADIDHFITPHTENSVFPDYHPRPALLDMHLLFEINLWGELLHVSDYLANVPPGAD
jgi:hypothetical protein